MDEGLTLRVLIADADEGMRAAARFVLEDEGFEVVGEARSSLEAVFQAMSSQPDLVLLDHRSSSLDNIVVNDLLRNSAPEAGIVAFSRASTNGDEPGWADATLRKDHLHKVGEVLRQVADERSSD